MIIIILIDISRKVKPIYSFNDSLKIYGSSDMELKYDKNNQLVVRLAIVESQLKYAKEQIAILKNRNEQPHTKPFQVK